jgi:hypothetical protein
MFQQVRNPAFVKAFVLVAHRIFIGFNDLKIGICKFLNLIINVLHFDGFNFSIKVL